MMKSKLAIALLVCSGISVSSFADDMSSNLRMDVLVSNPNNISTQMVVKNGKGENVQIYGTLSDNQTIRLMSLCHDSVTACKMDNNTPTHAENYFSLAFHGGGLENCLVKVWAFSYLGKATVTAQPSNCGSLVNISSDTITVKPMSPKSTNQ